MATLPQNALDTLRSRLSGRLILPGDEQYEPARTPWLRVIDQHPALIVQADSTADIVAAIRFAQEHQLPLGVQTTGHGIAKACDGGLLLNLSHMTNLTIDAATRQAQAGPGLKWTDLLKAAQPHGLVAPSGQVGNVGVMGYTLGGGIGWLVRKHGPACGHVVAATVVLATGEVIRASADEHPDLLWALRGGGGNFGVVTELEIQLVAEPEVLAGLRWYPLEQAATLLPAYRDWTDGLSDNTSTVFRFLKAPDEAPFPDSIRGKAACAIGVCHADPATADALLKSMAGLGEPVLDQVRTMPYLAVSDIDPASHQDSAKAYTQTAYLNRISDAGIHQLIDAAPAAMPPVMVIELLHLGGRLRTKMQTDGAFNASSAQFLLHTVATMEKSSPDEVAQVTQTVFDSVTADLTGELSYNFLRGDQQPEVAKAFMATDFARLQAIKQRYDPQNVFKLNLNIEPATA